MRRAIHSNRDKRKEEGIISKLAGIFEQIRKRSVGGAIVLVEGKRDERVLLRLGVPGRILRYSDLGEKRTIEALEGTGRRVIILTDFDREGDEIAARMENAALTGGFMIDKTTRKRLFELARNYASELEGLSRLVSRIRRQRLTEIAGERGSIAPQSLQSWEGFA